MKKGDSIFTMVFVLTITCVISGLCLSYTYNLTKTAIAEAEVEATLKAVREVLPAFDGDPEIKMVLLEGAEKALYIGRKNDAIVGVAIESDSLGYGGTLKMLVGVDSAGAIYGMKLLTHKETPGLGTKAGEPAFLDQFKGVSLPDQSAELKVTADGGTIEAVTAATISSRAVARAATKALHIYLTSNNEG